MIEILAAAGLVTVQDGGRPGRMHEGVPPGGALVPELLAAANAAGGNPAGAAAIEIVGTLRVRAGGAPLTVAVDDDPAQMLAPGETLAVASSERTRARILAVAGGVDVPVVLGGRGTLLVAGLGGLDGRPLRAGDRLPVGTPGRVGPPPPRVDLDPARPLGVVPGPDLDRFAPDALVALLGAELTVTPVGDRAGIRLAAPAPVARALAARDATAPSAPMVRGAIQVTPSGELVALGPDHPVTGGYPVIATVIREDVGKLAARWPGARVRLWAAPAPTGT
jgi:allophanate hydrolase subunit 2